MQCSRNFLDFTVLNFSRDAWSQTQLQPLYCNRQDKKCLLMSWLFASRLFAYVLTRKYPEEYLGYQEKIRSRLLEV